jgi:type I restriction enzyme M protein
MDLAQHNMIVNFIWGIADDCLRDVYVRGKYRDVILPMTVTICNETYKKKPT